MCPATVLSVKVRFDSTAHYLLYKAMIGLIHGNATLTCLDLRDTKFLFGWVPHLDTKDREECVTVGDP